jgi:ATP-dependent RNA helicase DeaD
VGRTGRAGVKGTAISFVSSKERYRIKFIERKIGQPLLPYDLPNVDAIKLSKVQSDLQKMEGLKNAVIEKEEDFDIDATYEYFREELKDCSKEQVLKILFSHLYHKDFRLLQDSLQIKKSKPVKVGRLRKEDRQRKSRRATNDALEKGRRGGRSRRKSRPSKNRR